MALRGCGGVDLIAMCELLRRAFDASLCCCIGCIGVFAGDGERGIPGESLFIDKCDVVVFTGLCYYTIRWCPRGTCINTFHL